MRARIAPTGMTGGLPRHDAGGARRACLGRRAAAPSAFRPFSLATRSGDPAPAAGRGSGCTWSQQRRQHGSFGTAARTGRQSASRPDGAGVVGAHIPAGAGDQVGGAHAPHEGVGGDHGVAEDLATGCRRRACRRRAAAEGPTRKASRRWPKVGFSPCSIMKAMLSLQKALAARRAKPRLVRSARTASSSRAATSAGEVPPHHLDEGRLDELERPQRRGARIGRVILAVGFRAHQPVEEGVEGRLGRARCRFRRLGSSRWSVAWSCRRFRRLGGRRRLRSWRRHAGPWPLRPSANEDAGAMLPCQRTGQANGQANGNSQCSDLQVVRVVPPGARSTCEARARGGQPYGNP